MDMLTLIETIRDAVHDDSDTQTWCTANYSRNHKVYVGIDMRNPPGDSDCPLVHLFPKAKISGYELDDQDHIIAATPVLSNENTRTVAGKDNVVEMLGISHMETFRKYVETAVVGATPSGMFINILETEYDPIEFFPFFIAPMEFKFTKTYYQGMDVFE